MNYHITFYEKENGEKPAEGQEIIVTNGFVKKMQKTPHSEIELAEKYRDEFLKKRGLK